MRVQALVVLAPWLCLVACDNGNGNSNSNITLTSVGPAGAGSTCSNGGVTISSGKDTNGNGVLDTAEITDHQDVCNGTTATPGMQGTSGFNTLVKTSTLPNGDLNCVQGGTRIDTGLDDGSGGGTANDGVLQAGEIKSTQYVCNGTQKSIPGATAPGATDVAGAYKIDTSGGNGTTSGGGSGGSLTLEMYYGTLGGHVKIFNKGVVDASFTVPTVAFNAGAVPCVVSVDPTTLKSYANTAAGITSADTCFLVNGQNTLYKNVAGVATQATSLDVQEGKTLTINADSGTSDTYITVQNDIRNAGTIKTAFQADAKSHVNLHFSCSMFQGVSGSAVNLAGLAVTGSTGGTGGYLEIYTGSHLINQGMINVSGGNGDSGGSGGGAGLYSTYGDVYNTGAIDSHGGTGAVTSGGSGQWVYIAPGYRSANNSGAVNLSGGDGVTDGGSGGWFYWYENNIGSHINSGNFTSKGGACSATNCNGGSGGWLYISSTADGDTLNSGNIDLSGADGKGTGSGGSGGLIYVYNSDGSTNYDGSQDLPTGSIRFSGNLTLKGGSGASGGSGGSLQMYLSAQNVPNGQEIAFYGYTDINLSGGSSSGAGGGNAGYFNMYQDNPAYMNGNSSTLGPAGAVINYANVVARGGSGLNSGGSGAYAYMQTQRWSNGYFNNPYEFAANYGTFDLRGGNCSAASCGAGYGGYFELQGAHHVYNEGAVTYGGGTATGNNSSGNSSNEIYFHSDYGPLTNKGALDGSGGGGGATGGNGGGGSSIYLSGSPVTNSGALAVNGGAAGTNGGNGGYIELFSSPTGPTTNTGTFGVSGGAATNAGAKGTVRIDGADATP